MDDYYCDLDEDAAIEHGVHADEVEESRPNHDDFVRRFQVRERIANAEFRLGIRPSPMVDAPVDDFWF